MKRIIFILLAAVLVLCGCGAAPAETTHAPRETGFGYSLYDDYLEQGIEMEDFSDNLEYDYVKWAYNGWFHFSPSEEEREQGLKGASWVCDWNLTKTDQKAKGHDWPKGCMLITIEEEYKAVLASIAATEAAALYHCGTYEEPQEVLRTWEGEFDEEFFRDHDLILVDFCFEGNPFLRSRLDSVEVMGYGVVTVKISFETTYAYTGDQPGEVYWIVMPKGCRSLTVEYTETAWN